MLASRFVKTTVVLSVFAMLTSCTGVSFNHIYPAHFPTPSGEGSAIGTHIPEVRILQNPNEIPPEIVEVLPAEFRLAHHVGLLTVILDGSGKMYPASRSLSYTENSADFYSKIQLYQSTDYRNLKPMGYPHVFAAMPDIDITETFALELGQDWLRMLHQYYNKLEEVEKIHTEISNLAQNIANSANTSSELDVNIASIESQIAASRARTQQLRQEAAQINQENNLLAAEILGEPLNISYHYPADLFREVYEERLVNVRGRLSMRGVGNPHLHLEAVEAIELANAMITNPSAYFDTEIAQQISDANLTPLTLASASRSILEQAALSSATRAGYLDSNHALGVAFDLAFAGTNYNVRTGIPDQETLERYSTLMIVLDSAGITRPTVDSNQAETNHFVVTRYAARSQGEKNPDFDHEAYVNLAIEMFTAFREAGDRAWLDALTSINTLSKRRESLVRNYHLLQQEIEQKLEKLKSKRNELKGAQAKERAAERERQHAFEQRARRIEAERQRQESLRRERRERDRADNHEARREAREAREARDRAERERNDRERRDREREQIERERDRPTRLREWSRGDHLA